MNDNNSTKLQINATNIGLLDELLSETNAWIQDYERKRFCYELTGRHLRVANDMSKSIDCEPTNTGMDAVEWCLVGLLKLHPINTQ